MHSIPAGISSPTHRDLLLRILEEVQKNTNHRYPLLGTIHPLARQEETIFLTYHRYPHRFLQVSWVLHLPSFIHMLDGIIIRIKG